MLAERGATVCLRVPCGLALRVLGLDLCLAMATIPLVWWILVVNDNAFVDSAILHCCCGCASSSFLIVVSATD